MKRTKAKENPKVITESRIVTERHKAEDVIKMGQGWTHTGLVIEYNGVDFWELRRK